MRNKYFWSVGLLTVLTMAAGSVQGESAMNENIFHIRLPAPFSLEFDLKGASVEDLQKSGCLRTKDTPYEPQCDGKNCRIYLGDTPDDCIADVQGRETSYSPVYIRFEIVDIDPSDAHAVQKLLTRQKGHTEADIKTETNAHGVTLSSIAFFYTGGPSYTYTLIHHKPAILVSNDSSLMKQSVRFTVDLTRELSDAFKHQRDGKAFLVAKEFEQANHEFRAGLAVLAKASQASRTDRIDDTGQKLTLAGHQQDQGDFEHAAAILDRVLESRLEMAVPISREKVIEIARLDTEKADRDFSMYKVQALLGEKGWIVFYSLKDFHGHGGGGPEYLIDADTGKILSKHYAR